jgi:hypothetical protein
MCGHYKASLKSAPFNTVLLIVQTQYENIVFQDQRVSPLTLFLKNILTFMRRPDHILFYRHIMFYSDRTLFYY